MMFMNLQRNEVPKMAPFHQLMLRKLVTEERIKGLALWQKESTQGLVSQIYDIETFIKN